MSKTIKKSFDEKLTFESLLEAHKRARKGKANKTEILRFQMDLESNIINIMNALKTETYKMGKYREFRIYIPKERVIKALPYPDRVVHQWYIHEFIKPYMYKRFIKDTFACIDERGTHQAKATLQRYMRIMRRKYGSYYIVKFDIKKFFYSIDKAILFKKMEGYISDQKLLRLTFKFIYDCNDPVGIPIGNYTSQYFANIYLHEFDLYVKHQLHMKYYVRYMDDFIMLVETKEEAKNLMDLVNTYITTNLNIELNHKSGYFPNHKGVNFCGYIIHEDYVKLKQRSKANIRAHIKQWKKDYEKGILDEEKMWATWKSWLSHSKHANTYTLTHKYAAMLPIPAEDFSDECMISNDIECTNTKTC